MDDEATILIVCGANQARSPLAAELLRKLADYHLGQTHTVAVSSAGTTAFEMAPVIPHMRVAAERLGVNLATHRARALDPELVRKSQLIVTMTEAQRTTVSRLQAQALTRVFTLKELVRLGTAIPSARLPLRDRVRVLHQSRAVVADAGGAEDVADPNGLDYGGTAAVAAEIASLAEAAGRVLFAPHS